MRRWGKAAPEPGANGYDKQFVPLAEASSARRRQIVLVPGAAVPLLPLDLPEKLRGMAREQVARRQLQDRFGLAPDRIEMRPFSGNSGGPWDQVLIADAALLKTWRDAVPKQRTVMLPDYFALPTTDGLWTVHVGRESVALRFGPEHGCSCQRDLALVILKERLADLNLRPKALLMLGQSWPDAADWVKKNAIPVVHAPADVAQIDGLDTPTVLSHGETASNLHRDPALVRDRLRAQLRPWRWPLTILAVAVSLWTASDLLDIQRLRAERIAIQSATEDLVRDVFVPQGPILDVRSQVMQAEEAMRRAATGNTEAVNALRLFEDVAPVIFAADAQMRRVSSPDGIRLDLVIETEDFATADSLSSTLSEMDGLDLRVVESRRTGDGASVRTELQLRDANGGQP